MLGGMPGSCDQLEVWCQPALCPLQVGWPTALATSERKQFAMKVRATDMLLIALTTELPCPELPWLPAD